MGRSIARIGKSILIITLQLTAANLWAQTYTTEQQVGDLVRPVKYVKATGRAFVVEQPGRIRVIQNGSLRSSPAMTLASVYSGGNETGLLGMALHPQFESNRRFFLNFTTKRRGRLETQVSEFTMGTNDIADPSTEREILKFDQPFENHNGGEIVFGADGMLYISTGDGGSANDPSNNGQRGDTFLGKVLRIDIDRRTGDKAYGIPGDNPFIANAAANFLPEIYAYGLRNPWRMSFDPQTGWLWAGDVGQNIREEVDIIRSGSNYGWRLMEGILCFNPRPCNVNNPALTKPVIDYDHETGGQSITGGLVYRGNKTPSLAGKYIYGDYISGNIWALTVNTSGLLVRNDLILGESGHAVSAFAESTDGDLILLDHQAGAVVRIKEQAKKK